MYKKETRERSHYLFRALGLFFPFLHLVFGLLFLLGRLLLLTAATLGHAAGIILATWGKRMNVLRRLLCITIPVTHPPLWDTVRGSFWARIPPWRPSPFAPTTSPSQRRLPSGGRLGRRRTPGPARPGGRRRGRTRQRRGPRRPLPPRGCPGGPGSSRGIQSNPRTRPRPPRTSPPQSTDRCGWRPGSLKRKTIESEAA